MQIIVASAISSAVATGRTRSRTLRPVPSHSHPM
jgi:hypothetical protein